MLAIASLFMKSSKWWFNGLILAGVASAVASCSLIEPIGAGKYRLEQEAAFVRQYGGSQSLDNLITKHGLDYTGLSARIDVRSALTEGCSQDAASYPDICPAYEKLNQQVAVHEQSQHSTAKRNVGYGFAGLTLTLFLGSYMMLKRAQRSDEQYVATPAVP